MEIENQSNDELKEKLIKFENKLKKLKQSKKYQKYEIYAKQMSTIARHPYSFYHPYFRMWFYDHYRFKYIDKVSNRQAYLQAGIETIENELYTRQFIR